MKAYSRIDIENALRDAGLAEGDTVFVTTSLGMLGIAQDNGQAIDSLDALNSLHLDALKNVVGIQGTIIVPTYSYSFGASNASEYAIFDPATTPSKIGPFPEFFRLQPGVLRSLDPMMSVAALGPEAKALLDNLTPTSYGQGCLFSRLAETDAKCCSIGLGPNWTPFIHHVDWLSGAEFRFDKLFHGLIKVDGLLSEKSWVYSVAVLCPEADPNGYVIGNGAAEAGIWRYAPLGRARVYLCSYKEYFKYALSLAKKNPWITAVGPPTNVLELERRRVPPQTSPCVTTSPCESIVDLYSTVAKFERDEVSDGAEEAFKTLSRYIPLSFHRFRTGERHYDWIIPEKWQVQRASLSNSLGSVVWSLDDGRERVYSYSLSVRKKLARETLVRHVRVSSDNVRPQYTCSIDRDWGFCCTTHELENLKGDEFDVDIASTFSCGELIVGDFLVPGTKDDCILVISYLSGIGESRNLLGAISAVGVANTLATMQGRETSVRFLWITSPAGFKAWMNTHRALHPYIRGVIEFDDITSDVTPVSYTRASRMTSAIMDQVSLELQTTTTTAAPETLRLHTPGRSPIATSYLALNSLDVISFGSTTSSLTSVSPLPPATLKERGEKATKALVSLLCALQ
jgi:aminoglycoside N3'-acetyltransferase